MCSALCGITELDQTPNSHIVAKISTAVNSNGEEQGEIDMKTGLDSHANMCVFGDDCFVFEWLGQTCSINPFTASLGKATDVPICDLAVAYDHQSDDGPETFILLFRNTLCIPEMKHNLVPPFIVRKAGHVGNKCPKFQCVHPSVEDHCIILDGESNRVCILLQLNGTFSYFHTRKPSMEELHGCPKIFLTPDSTFWNLYCESFENNERAMTNWKGKLILNAPRKHELMALLDEFGDVDISAAQLDTHIDSTLSNSFHLENFENGYVFQDVTLAQQLNDRAEISLMMATLASTHSGSNEDNNLFVSSLSVDNKKGVSKEFLSKI